MRNIVLLSVGCLCLVSPVWAVSVNYTETVDGWTESDSVPTTASSASRYWYTDVAGSYFASDDWWGGQIDGSGNRRFWFTGTGPQSANLWRNFRTGGELAADEYIQSPVLRARLTHGGGDDGNPYLWSRIWLLNENNCGYVGEINRPGRMILSRVDNGVKTQIAADDGSAIPDGNMKLVKLSVAGGVVNLSFNYDGSSTVYSVSAADSTYQGFNLIGVGGSYGWGEQHSIDDIYLKSSGEVNYSDSFDGWTNNECFYIPTAVTDDASKFWTTDQAGRYILSDDWWIGGRRLWNSLGGSQSVNIFRNLRLGGTIPYDKYLKSPTLQGLLCHGGGDNFNTAMWSRIWLLNENNCGYVGEINRPGTMILSRVDNGVKTQIAYNSGLMIPDGNSKVMKLSAKNRVVTLSFNYSGNPMVYSILANEETYSLFTIIGLGGSFTSGEQHTIDDISLTGTITPEPEEWESQVTRGHRTLIKRGLQIQSMCSFVFKDTLNPTTFTLSTFLQGGFTAPFLDWNASGMSHLGAAPGVPWSRHSYGRTLYDAGLAGDEMAYLSNLISLSYKDEQDITSQTELNLARDWFTFSREHFPDVINYTNQSDNAFTLSQINNYISYCHPDMLCFDSYPFGNGNTACTNKYIYEYLQKYRQAGLAGLDGTGARPIPCGIITQQWIYHNDSDPVNYKDHMPSETELRLEVFGAWAFGYKFVNGFFYNDSDEGNIFTSILFTGTGDTTPTAKYTQVATLNTMSRNLGPALVRLISTDARMVMGRHHGTRKPLV